MGNSSGKKVIEFGDDIYTMEKLVGTGAFGKVYAMLNKKGDILAMKQLDKRLLIEKKAIPGTLRENEFLQRLDNPFIVNLNGALQNHTHLLMILDFMAGGDLAFHLSHAKNSQFSEEQTKFYAACLLIGLEYLHGQGIVHRDLKPDNVMLTREGYACLTDFNVAKELENDGKVTGYAGTFGYMAPELFMEKGTRYGPEVDVWSAGVLLYRMLTGFHPFKSKPHDSTKQYLSEHKSSVNHRADSDDEEKQKVIKRIKRMKARYSSKFFNKESEEFISSMIAPPDQRKTTKELMQMDWVKDLPWDEIRKQSHKPPFIPEDKANVDPSLHVEEIFSIKQKVQPLTDSEQEQFASWDWLKKKYRTQDPIKHKKRSLLKGCDKLHELHSATRTRTSSDMSTDSSNVASSSNNNAASSTTSNSSSSSSSSSSDKKDEKKKDKKKSSTKNN